MPSWRAHSQCSEVLSELGQLPKLATRSYIAPPSLNSFSRVLYLFYLFIPLVGSYNWNNLLDVCYLLIHNLETVANKMQTSIYTYKQSWGEKKKGCRNGGLNWKKSWKRLMFGQALFIEYGYLTCTADGASKDECSRICNPSISSSWITIEDLPQAY